MKKKTQSKEKYFVIRKVVKARTISSALKKEKETDVLEVHNVVPRGEEKTPAIGFDCEYDDSEFSE